MEVLLARSLTPPLRNHVRPALNIFRETADYGSVDPGTLPKKFNELEANLQEYWERNIRQYE
jgi:hypothetical protein